MNLSSDTKRTSNFFFQVSAVIPTSEFCPYETMMWSDHDSHGQPSCYSCQKAFTCLEFRDALLHFVQNRILTASWIARFYSARLFCDAFSPDSQVIQDDLMFAPAATSSYQQTRLIVDESFLSGASAAFVVEIRFLLRGFRDVSAGSQFQRRFLCGKSMPICMCSSTVFFCFMRVRLLASCVGLM